MSCAGFLGSVVVCFFVSFVGKAVVGEGFVLWLFLGFLCVIRCYRLMEAFIVYGYGGLFCWLILGRWGVFRRVIGVFIFFDFLSVGEVGVVCDGTWRYFLGSMNISYYFVR